MTLPRVEQARKPSDTVQRRLVTGLFTETSQDPFIGPAPEKGITTNAGDLLVTDLADTGRDGMVVRVDTLDNQG